MISVRPEGALVDLVPAVPSGSVAFPEGLPLVRPSIPDIQRILADVRAILDSRVLTKGPYVEELEARAAAYLGVRHCVAVSSCTAGLMLLLRAADLEGEVVVPSFTFPATVHPVVWNGLSPVFCDVSPDTLTLSPEAAAEAAGRYTSAIVATHTYGTPCRIEALAEVAASRGLRLFFDAAHALGAWHGGLPVGGFGDAEVFSLAPTKLVIACEGGLIATDDAALAGRCRIGRDYGNPGDYDCRLVGLNARMSEIHAAVALASLDGLDERIDRRNALAATYREALAGIPGLRFPEVLAGDRSTYKDFTILVDPEEFGLDAVRLGRALGAQGVETRRYYAPAVHTMEAYRFVTWAPRNLPVTDEAVDQVLTIPLWPEMTEQQVGRVAYAIRRVQRLGAGGEERQASGRCAIPLATTEEG
jgi:dTDP-4-amino-4,6-dideoxygalactose transaminase